jgi:hypothetical protein
LIINFTGGTIACIESASRQLFIVAHSHGLPFSTFIVRTSLPEPPTSVDFYRFTKHIVCL